MRTNPRRALLVSAAVLAATLISTPAPADAPPPAIEVPAATAGGLTADDVARRAEATSFDVRAKRAALDAAAADVNQALTAFFPRVTLTARYTRLSSIEQGSLGNLVVAPGAPPGPLPPGTPLVNAPLELPAQLDQIAFQASLSVPLSDYVLRLSQSYAAASHSERAASLSARAASAKAAADARIAFYDWARSRLQRAAAEQTLAQAKLHLADAQRLFDAGLVSRADVLRVESQVASSELLLERAGAFADLGEERLATLMHTPAEPLALGEDLTADLPPLPRVHDLEALQAEAAAQRLEIRALDQTAWALRDQASAARAGYFPRVDAFGEVTYANPNPRVMSQQDQFRATWSAGVQLTWVINDLPASASASERIEARAREVAAQRGALRDALRLEVADARRALREAAAAIRTTARGLASAEESYRVRRELFINGRATSAELTDAETDLLRARLETINAAVDLRIARVRLLHAAGRDVAGVKGGGA